MSESGSGAAPAIRVRGARQNNLRDLDLDIPLNRFVVVTGVSGSGKSSLAFDTVYAEGQRRYVETFSPYARQFLDRMDKPAVDSIEGIPPAIAIDQTNPVRTSRSTVGTMTELNDHLKLLFARAADLYCGGCGRPVRRDDPGTIVDALRSQPKLREQRVSVTFRVPVPESMAAEEVERMLAAQGYTRIHSRGAAGLEVIQDRLRVTADDSGRLSEAVETALHRGRGSLAVYPLDRQKRPQQPLRFSADLHCPDCDRHYEDPIPSRFSFNSPIGACGTCRGFGRVMGIDYDLVVPDARLSLAEGAVKPWQSDSYRECQDELLRFARRRGVPEDVPWQQLSDTDRQWVIEGEGDWEDGVWYGIRRFFDWLETKSYRMHIRVLLSRYRAYNPCPDCGGARLKSESLLWRLGNAAESAAALQGRAPFRPVDCKLTAQTLNSLPGLHIHDLMRLPIADCAAFFDALRLPPPMDQATDLLIGEIRSRLGYLVQVGLGYLSLDRQSRTLSGGEVQRINLTTALGTSLVNTLFVLDEPSIGLHPRDLQRLVEILRRLRASGNSLLVVEHDPALIEAADTVLDMGPGPGAAGGRLVYAGPPRELARHEGSLTGAYLDGRLRVSARPPRPIAADPPDMLEIRGASAHNLRNVDARLPLGRLTCVCGVSGSGKSTLIQDVLFNALAKHFGKPQGTPGAHRALLGAEALDDVILVDQSPIGRTTRSNPASYVGALGAIRNLFAAEPLARERAYKPSTFSFNSGNGRCPGCGGNGFEHLEMQFLSDVYLRCPDCDGRRYRPEILEVRLAGAEGPPASIADVLDMTVEQALAFFAGQPKVLDGLEPLAEVGLEYLRLGQPVPTLSGGEAQRLKLAGHLAKAPRRGARGALFLLDEPTTGLHFHDVARLMAALDRLLEAGHSVVVIEHNLDVIGAADWILELGPEGGGNGGQVVFEGTPAELRNHPHSHTGEALRASERDRSQRAIAEAPAVQSSDSILIRHAREHNLQNVDIRIPRDRLTVITGISGSGKSTVAFDILFAEGQRRYLESLNAYARQFVQPAARPEVDAILGVPPTVAIEQRTSRGGRKSTVATMTEIYHFLRLLFVKLGLQHCPDCQLPIEAQSPDTVIRRMLGEYRGVELVLLAPLVSARKGYYTDLAAWAAGRGFSRLRVDGQWLPTDPWPRLDRFREHDIDLPVATVTVKPEDEGGLREALDTALAHGNGLVKLLTPEGREHLFSTRRACPGCGRSFPELDPRLFSFNSKHGWCPGCFGTGQWLPEFREEETGEENHWTGDAQDAAGCPQCQGRRLRPEALAVRFRERSIDEYTALPVAQAGIALGRLELSEREATVARDLLAELRARLGFLAEVGLGYLALDRAAPTLSGGEAQRLRLAAQLGSNLRGVCYILDEPTIGLHPRDNRLLLDTLAALQRKGNTVVVVEHDEETIRSAEHLLDLGPGAGSRGGRLVAQGTLQDLLDSPDSVTGRCLSNPLRHPLMPRRATGPRQASRLRVRKARLNNLRDVSLGLPLGRLVCVTGVSGSGKSTLVRQVVHDNLRQWVGRRETSDRPRPRGCQSLTGWRKLDRVLEVDQTPIGKTPRSCPATYVGFWDDIRKLFAATREARLRGFTAARFSFNVRGGRCEACDGQGERRVEMSFLPDVKVPCDVCSGARFNAETLAVHYGGHDAGTVLNMSVAEALEAFSAHRRIRNALELLRDVGLDYLRLGQPSPTLSGGEAQRIKLVTELAKASGSERHTLYVLDEPTVGLHMADVEKLIRVLHRLVDAGNSVLLIEHNLDVIAECDWVVDLGPEGGDGGGRVVAEGPPEQLCLTPESHTGRSLAEFLQTRVRADDPDARESNR